MPLAREKWRGCLAGACLLLAGCASIPPARPNFNSDDSSERILAIKSAAQAGDRSAVPLIVDRLEDEDNGVQFFAMLALERLTGERFGLESGQSSAERSAAIQRWRAYVDQGSHKVSLNRGSNREASQPDNGAMDPGAVTPGEVTD